MPFLKHGGSGPSATVYTAPGAAPGFDTSLDLDYDSGNSNLPEPWYVRVQNISGVLTRAFWLNESGLPRAWAVRKNEAAFRAHAYTDASTAAVIEVRGPWNSGAVKRWGINGQGQPLIGANDIVGANVIVLAAADPVPAGLPAGTVIVRTQ